MSKNLDVEKFRNGDKILEVKSEIEWNNAFENNIPAFCYYNFDNINGNKYGKLYNWFAIIDSRGLAPMGWRLPLASDFENLVNFLGRNAGID
jgi:uncharacterized protein (TIGR02145 family)